MVTHKVNYLVGSLHVNNLLILGWSDWYIGVTCCFCFFYDNCNVVLNISKNIKYNC